MRYLFPALLPAVLIVLAFTETGFTQPVESSSTPGDRLIAEYFRGETRKLEERTFADIETLEDWTRRRPEYRRQLLEMLGLDPMPPKAPLEPVVTGTLEESGVIVERLHFQSMPGLYVTANLYRPNEQQGKLPAILYVCGHGGERHDGKSLGNKTHYQHHGAWFARNGYVCLTIDTVQLGEIEGIHHGTYREKMWWWNNRGYSSAGVEAFNCIRSLDYLQSRAEVDGDRIGVTGRSGGGAYSWWIAAIDQRITAAVPVAGITNLKNHVVDGCVEGHCDCMYMVNTYRWDYPMVAALVAPRPLLISNSDKDRIFPLDGVVDVYAKVQKIYDLYDARDKLGLQITEGPHKDTQELRIAAFRWMNRFLREDQSLIETAAKPLFEKRDLKVFDSLPQDQRVTRIHESFIAKAEPGDLDWESPEAVHSLIERLRELTFRGWPDSPEPLDVTSVAAKEMPDARVIEFNSQSPFRLPVYVLQPNRGADAHVDVVVLDDAGWKQWGPALAVFFPDHVGDVKPDRQLAETLRQTTANRNTAYIVPRGVGPTRWTDDERTQTHLRRRFMLLGQTLAGMQVYDVYRAVKALRQTPRLEAAPVSITAAGDAAVWGLYASLFVDRIDALNLKQLPERNRDAPDLLNVSRIVEIEDVVKAARTRLVGK